MPVTAASLRTRYPDIFGSTTTFPDAVLTSAILEATLVNDPNAWPADNSTGSFYDTAISYYAGYLALESVRRFIGTSGGSGNIQSIQSLVGSVSYDTAASSIKSLSESFLDRYTRLARQTSPSIGISG